MKTVILITTIGISLIAHGAEIATNQGLQKIKSNAESSRKNRDEIKKNLQVVTGNLNEIKKNKDALTQQKKNVSTELIKNIDAYKKLSQQEKEIVVLIGAEKTKLKTEESQMQQLANQIGQLRKNQEQRQAIIAEYQIQLHQAVQRKNEWKQREQILQNQEQQSSEAIRKISSEENTWLSKKTAYEKDHKKWTNEAANHQKIHDTYQGFANGK
jgi:chromosome segregation ATPase